MSKILVDCVRGNDDSTDVHTSPLKTLDYALELLSNDGKIFLYPGNYDGCHLISTNNTFNYEIESTGKDVIITTLIQEGYINSIFNDMKIRDVDIKCCDSDFIFNRVSFITSHRMSCVGFLGVRESVLTEIEFRDCVFEPNFQIHVISGVYSIVFKNCKFQSNVIPIVYIKSGIVDIKVTMCNLRSPLVSNQNGTVYIYQASSTFANRIWIGSECTVVSENSTLSTSGMTGFSKSYSIPIESTQAKPMGDTYSVAIDVDTDEFPETVLELKSNTEFISCHGRNSLTIILSENCTNGHKIEILNNTPFVLINDVQFYEMIIYVRYVDTIGWIFYNEKKIF